VAFERARAMLPNEPLLKVSSATEVKCWGDVRRYLEKQK
jgi:hypothetical protein